MVFSHIGRRYEHIGLAYYTLGQRRGLGIGGLCAVALSALLCLGLLCDEATARQLRLCFLCRFLAEQGCLHCAGLSRGDCRSLVAAGAALTQELLESVGCQPAASRSHPCHPLQNTTIQWEENFVSFPLRELVK